MIKDIQTGKFHDRPLQNRLGEVEVAFNFTA